MGSPSDAGAIDLDRGIGKGGATARGLIGGEGFVRAKKQGKVSGEESFPPE